MTIAIIDLFMRFIQHATLIVVTLLCVKLATKVSVTLCNSFGERCNCLHQFLPPPFTSMNAPS